MTPDGTYENVPIVAAGFDYMGQNPCIAVSLKFPSGEIHQWKGRTSGTDSKNRDCLARTLSELRTLGCSDPRQLESLVGKAARSVKVQNRGKYVNIYVQRPPPTKEEQQAIADELAARMQGGQRPGQQFGNDDGDIPF